MAAGPGTGLEGAIELADGLVLKGAEEGRFLLPKKDSDIPREIIRSGVWAPGDVSLFKRLIEPGQTVVDAGANIGHHSVVFSKAAGTSGRVVAFEPQAYLFILLCANLALNGCRNCLPFRMALGETSGTLRMGFLDYETDNNFGALCSSTTHPEWAVGEEIEIVTLDAFLSSRKLRPHFIKIDVQNLRAVRFARSAANPAGLPAHPVY
jgi:FkbM family methyltransferase